jgi:hypothetical protein
MTAFDIKLPVGDPRQPLDAKAVSELPSFLEDPDDRAICRELLSGFLFNAGDSVKTIGALATVLDAADQPLRRRLLDVLRQRVGMPTTGEELAEHATRTHVPDTRPVRTVLLPSGALVAASGISSSYVKDVRGSRRSSGRASDEPLCDRVER